jgi:hypothetical protein
MLRRAAAAEPASRSDRPLVQSLTFVFLLCGIFSVARGIADLRQRRFVWGGFGVFAGLLLLLTPVPTQRVSFALPLQSGHR